MQKVMHLLHMKMPYNHTHHMHYLGKCKLGFAFWRHLRQVGAYLHYEPCL